MTTTQKIPKTIDPSLVYINPKGITCTILGKPNLGYLKVIWSDIGDDKCDEEWLLSYFQIEGYVPTKSSILKKFFSPTPSPSFEAPRPHF